MSYDIFVVAQDKHIPGMILLIDFEKKRIILYHGN